MDDSNGLTGNTVSTAFLKALKRLLRPLVRSLIAQQVSYPMLCKLLKKIYIEVAISDFPLANKEQSDSRINLLTGVHRKDVKKLRTEEEEHEFMPENISLGSQLISIWVSDPDYLDEDGHPRSLQRLQSDNSDSSFEALVRNVNKDIRPRVVLDEWLRLGLATLDEEDRVSLITEAFIPEKGFDEKAYYFGQNIHDHIAASHHNLSGETPALFERTLTSDALSAASVDALTGLVEESAMQALLTVNKEALALEKVDAGKDEQKHRISFGIYFYQEPANHED